MLKRAFALTGFCRTVPEQPCYGTVFFASRVLFYKNTSISIDEMKTKSL